MNSSMKRLDFATCGAVQVGGEEDIWQYLLSKASTSLIAIEDSRVNMDEFDRLTVTPLKYILKFKNLVKLELKSYFCSDGIVKHHLKNISKYLMAPKLADDLLCIADGLQKLKVLHLILLCVTSTGIKALEKLKQLEIFEFFVVPFICEQTDIVSLCIQHLPHLKVIGEVSDQPHFGSSTSFFHHNLMLATKHLQLEHYRYGMINPELRDPTNPNL
jgi:hypothetical protein